ncbi:MAG: energy-coupling factor transporter transmembrane protein EcfT [Cyanobacteriota bacterium]|nr:energy-coupling factor transporter transmembrane protein EcfT [Cyanobacteriota bacterium]
MDWLRQIPIGQYVDTSGAEHTSWLQRLDPRLKLAWTLAFLVTPVLAGPRWRLALVGLLLLVTLLSGVPSRIWRRSMPALLAFAALVGLLSLVLPTGPVVNGDLQRPAGEIPLAPLPPSSPPGPPAERAGMAWELVRWGPYGAGPLALGPFVVTRKSAELGINASTLLFTVVHSANLLLLTTAPEALVWAIDWWLRPLAWLGWPMERLGFTLLLALRFLPLVQEELQNLLRALATRAVNLKALGWKAGLALVLAVGERLLANVLLRSEQGAEALMARGGRWLPPDRLHQPEPVSPVPTLLSGLALALLLAMRWAFGGS